MAEPVRKLDALKQSVEQDTTKEKKDLTKIIQRLREKDDLKEIQANESPQVDLEKYKSKEKGAMGFIGNLYNSFPVLFSKPAKMLARMPMTNDLKNLLESAGMYVSPQAYLVLSAVVSVSVGFLVLIATLMLGTLLNNLLLIGLAPIIAIVAWIFTAVIILLYPGVKASERAAEIDKALPFALRQLATQVKAGVSFYQAMLSVANSKYGVLSDELRIVIRDLDSGLSLEQALIRFSNRTKSFGLQKALQQILRSMRTGGNLSQIISDIADDVSFETRMKIRDFTEKLNFINIIYIMVSVVAPVAIAIFSAIVQLPVFAGALPPAFPIVGFIGILFLMTVIVLITKRMEPSAW